MPTFHVPVTRTVRDDYTVTARSRTEAAVEVGVMIATGVEPDRSTELSRKVGTPFQPIDDPIPFGLADDQPNA